MLGAEGLQPISWRVWAGEIENTKKEETPFKVLEDRMGFLDIRVSKFRTWLPESIQRQWLDVKGLQGDGNADGRSCMNRSRENSLRTG